MRSTRGGLAAAGAGVLMLSVVVAWQWPQVPVHYRASRLDRARTLSAAKPWLVALGDDMREPWARELVLGKLGDQHQYLTFWLFFHVLADRADLPVVHGLGRRLEGSYELSAMWRHYLRWRGFPELSTVVQNPGRLPSASVSGLFAASYLPFSLMILHQYTGSAPAAPVEEGPRPGLPFPRWRGPVPLPELSAEPWAEDILMPLSPP